MKTVNKFDHSSESLIKDEKICRQCSNVFKRRQRETLTMWQKRIKCPVCERK